MAGDELQGLLNRIYDPVNNALKVSSSGTSATVETVNAVASAGSAQTIPAPTTASINRYVLDAPLCTFTMPTPVAGASFTVVLVQDATGGRFASLPGVNWGTAGTPVLSTGAGKEDTLAFLSVTGSGWKGYITGQGF